MNTVTHTHDVIDHLLGLQAGDPLHAVRHHRNKVVAATQGSYELLLNSACTDVSLTERLLLACCVAHLSNAQELLGHYQQRLSQLHVDAADFAAATTAMPTKASSARLAVMLEFAQKLIVSPIEGDAAALHALPQAGIATPAVVTLAQLIAFLSYQVRLLCGLKAMQQAMQAGQMAHAHELPPSVGSFAGRMPVAGTSLEVAPGTLIKARGFTNETLDWKAWLDVVDIAQATPEQIAVLEESHPKAKVSDYYLFLVHQPDILRQRSSAFNAIMYAPGGLSRAERELGATVVSRINGCVYCASVHAQRFEQLAKRVDVIAQVFENPAAAGTNARECAIVDFSIQITQTPSTVNANSIRSLQAVGLNFAEILDLVHSDAIFAWANRLMLNLGEPVSGNFFMELLNKSQRQFGVKDFTDLPWQT